MVWDGCAAEFRKLYASIVGKSTILIITAVNPKSYGGNLSLSTTYSTRFYRDANYEAIKVFPKSSSLPDGVPPTVNGGKTPAIIETFSIAEARKFVSTSTEQEKEFKCTAYIVEIVVDRGWKYIACGKCGLKLVESGSSLICKRCSGEPIGVVKYRVELAVTDGKDKTIFVMLDEPTTQLIHIGVTELIDSQPAMKDGVPEVLAELTGRTFEFELKISGYNFKSKYETFTVTRVVSDVQHPPPQTSTGPNEVDDHDQPSETSEKHCTEVQQPATANCNDISGQGSPLEPAERESKKARTGNSK
ncbi:PREDICTED: uncharacterized protein LOC109126357 [Camelina sativa]|uniref:Uncharacterized protein LOC109126357 n=1 Tax=Camelina sativa TaxID=90675 RepID=A0ABM1QF74_CAMSA|nr:PREDICTED: uncharacterized protein LOC109126357 [Camelina sativa]